MSQASTPTYQPSTQPLSPFAGFLSYLIPGLGQIYQGRVTKGLLFMIVLLSMFIYGQYLGNWMNVYMPVVEEFVNDPDNGGQKLVRNKNPLTSVYNRLHFAGQFWIGIAAWPAIYQYLELPVPDKENNPFWHDFQRGPFPMREGQFEAKLNQFLANDDKTPDLSWVYTVIAGVLNILVIYDAVAGPAYGAMTKPHKTVQDAAPRTEAIPS